jgi:drug/metabolite transporter (DMT)-like permease
MSSNTLGLIIGGLAPALLFGVFAILTKASTQYNLGSSFYLVAVGISCVILGLFSIPILPNNISKLPLQGIAFAALGGLAWGLGMLLVNVALSRFNTPISLLAPVYNMNTLVSIVLGLWIFAEWRNVSMPTLMIGTFLVTLGGIILSRA